MDVNGWAFVKSNDKHLEDCAICLRQMILTKVAPKKWTKRPMEVQVHQEENP
jgi:hypothetical protein